MHTLRTCTECKESQFHSSGEVEGSILVAQMSFQLAPTLLVSRIDLTVILSCEFLKKLDLPIGPGLWDTTFFAGYCIIVQRTTMKEKRTWDCVKKPFQVTVT